MSEKQFKVLSGGFDEDGNPLYLIKDTDIGFEWVGDFEICKKVIEQQSTINKLKEENEQLQIELNNYEKLTNLLADYDVHHYNRWINQIKNYVEKTNEGFEYNREFIIKLCLSYTLQSLRNGENLKRFRWDMVNNE